MAEIKPQAMINPEVPGGGVGGGAGATGGILSSVRDWFQKQDPNFWSILAGSIAQSAPPGSWQHQLGGTAAGMGRGQIMAKALEKQRGERRKEWDQLLRLIGGGGEGRGSPFGVRRDPLAGGEPTQETPGEPTYDLGQGWPTERPEPTGRSMLERYMGEGGL